VTVAGEGAGGEGGVEEKREEKGRGGGAGVFYGVFMIFACREKANSARNKRLETIG